MIKLSLEQKEVEDYGYKVDKISLKECRVIFSKLEE